MIKISILIHLVDTYTTRWCCLCYVKLLRRDYNTILFHCYRIYLEEEEQMKEKTRRLKYWNSDANFMWHCATDVPFRDLPEFVEKSVYVFLFVLCLSTLFSCLSLSLTLSHISSQSRSISFSSFLPSISIHIKLLTKEICPTWRLQHRC